MSYFFYRFIPEDMIFEHEPKAVCTELPVTYKPSLFFTTALCQSKVGFHKKYSTISKFSINDLYTECFFLHMSKLKGTFTYC